MKEGIGFIGYGLMARRRGERLSNEERGSICDPRFDSFPSLEQVCRESAAVVVSVPTGLLVDRALACIEAGARRILIEKPCGCSADEFQRLRTAAIETKTVLVPGYTLRHYPGIVAAKTGAERYGEPLHMRINYGHGGSAKGWRAEPGGGGELLDQGSHCIDLARSFLGPDLALAHATLTGRVLNEVEDNVFLTLNVHGAGFLARSASVATIHASWTEWKPAFQMRVVYERGVIEVSGLSTTYGPHTVTFCNERGTDAVLSYPNAENLALAAEWKAFLAMSYNDTLPMLDAALHTLQIIDQARCASY